MTAPATPRPHARQPEIDALRAQMCSSEFIAAELGISENAARHAVTYHDAALPAFARMAKPGISQKAIAERLGISTSLTRTLLAKLPDAIIAKVHRADKTRRREKNQRAKARKYESTPAGRSDSDAVSLELRTLIAHRVPRYDSVRVSM